MHQQSFVEPDNSQTYFPTFFLRRSAEERNRPPRPVEPAALAPPPAPVKCADAPALREAPALPSAPAPGPTVADVRRSGASALTVTCLTDGCGHEGAVRFERLEVPGNTPVADVASKQRFRCEACRGTYVQLARDAIAQLRGARR